MLVRRGADAGCLSYLHQQVHAAGGQIGLTYVPWSSYLTFHAFEEFSATARLQGAAYGATVAIKF